jgi:hypothetical protein
VVAAAAAEGHLPAARRPNITQEMELGRHLNLVVGAANTLGTATSKKVTRVSRITRRNQRLPRQWERNKLPQPQMMLTMERFVLSAPQLLNIRRFHLATIALVISVRSASVRCIKIRVVPTVG